MKLRLMMLLSFSLLFGSGVQAADFDYRSSIEKAIDEAIAGNVELAGAFALYMACSIAESELSPANRNATEDFIAILASCDGNFSGYGNFSFVIPVISVAAKAGHTHALAIVSYFTARAQASDVNSKSIVAAFANNGVIAVANADALADLSLVHSDGLIEMAAALVFAAAKGNRVAEAFLAQEMISFSARSCCCEYKAWNDIFATFFKASRAGNEKAHAVVFYFATLADNGDADAVALMTAFSAYVCKNMHVAAVAVE